LIIFKTNDGRGWGVKTVTSIPRGIFLMEYTGEIIDQEESLRRGAEQDERGLRYMFDLDFNDNVDAVYTIDAGNYGNLSRLINHNCDPNCLIWPVTTCSEDSSIYKLCYFTTRSIKAGEELSIDYTGANETMDDIESTMDSAENDLENDIAGQGNNIAHRHQKDEVTCKCGSAKCRGKMFL
jgi:histone-lysine N-methyltransferase SUV39H